MALTSVKRVLLHYGKLSRTKNCRQKDPTQCACIM